VGQPDADPDFARAMHLVHDATPRFHVPVVVQARGPWGDPGVRRDRDGFGQNQTCAGPGSRRQARRKRVARRTLRCIVL
jgi:hypothetical protein